MNSINIVGLTADNKKFIEILSDNIKITMGSDKRDISAISIGSPETFDMAKGLDDLKSIFSIPVFFLNDAKAAGLGEWWLGAGKGHSDLNYLTWGSGFGSAKIRNGQLEQGLGKAPEWGHTSIGIENKWWQCPCGQWGHAEAYLGTKGLAKIYSGIFSVKEVELSHDDHHTVSYKMREGVRASEQKWLKVQEEYAGYSAVLLRNNILVDRPKIIIIGGGIAFNNKPLLEEVKKQLKTLMDHKNDKMAFMAEGVQIVLAQFENAGNLGAAKYAFDLLDIAERGEKAYGDLA